MSFPFNFVPPQFPPFFGNNSANYPPQNDFSFFENPFMGQPFFNNFGNKIFIYLQIFYFLYINNFFKNIYYKFIFCFIKIL